MTGKDLKKIITAVGSKSIGPLQASMLPPFEDAPQELEKAIADAVAHGEPIAVISAVADLSPLAVLDALEAVATYDPNILHPLGNETFPAGAVESNV